MVKVKIKTQTLVIAMLILITIGITKVYVSKISKSKSSIDTFTLQATALRNTSNIKNMNAVVVRKNELLLVSINNKDENLILDSGGSFSRPIISPNRKYVSYLKDKILYITTDKLQHIKVADNTLSLSFAWQDKNNLLYSPTSGGLFVYDVVNKTSKPYFKNKFNYQNITLDSKGIIYAEQYMYFKKNGEDYRDDYGVLFFNLETKEKNLVIKSIPSKIDTGGDLGMYPIITGISADDTYLYIWKHPHAGSLAADGVELAVYDIANNKLMEYMDPNIISLGNSDNISRDPKNSRYLALIYGGGREMGSNKHLNLLDVLTGKFQTLSPRGEASMTPYYTSAGKTVLYASSDEQKNVTGALTKWLSSGNHFIFEINTSTKQIMQLTNNPNYFDFSPIYTENNDIIFFRNDKTDNVSIWKYNNGCETMLADGLIFYDDLSYPLNHYYGHFNTSLFTDVN